MTEQPQGDLALIDAFFTDKVQHIVASLYETERPPCGLAGLIDWHCFGLISEALKKGAITGREGECAYLPYTRRNKTFHIFLLGAGSNSTPAERKPFPQSSLDLLKKNLQTLRLQKVGISKTDFADFDLLSFSKTLKGASLWTHD